VKKSVIKSAKTVEEAVKLALAELDTTKDKVDIDVIEEPSSGFLGILGVKPAIVKIVEKEDQDKFEKSPRKSPKENKKEETKVYKKEETEIKKAKKVEQEPKQKPNKEIKPKDIESTTNQKEQEDFDVVDFLQQVCDHIMPGCEVSKSFEDKDEISLEIEGDNLGLIVGKHGETLNAIQYVTAMVYNNNIKNYKRVNVDAGGYRKRREEKIVEFSLKMANKVKDTGRRISLEPMNSYERRIVHIALQKVSGINTFSEGREPNRKIVITSTEKNNKSKYKQNNSKQDNNSEKERMKEERAKEERSYKALEKQHEQLNQNKESDNKEDQEKDNPYEHYYSKYDNRIKKK
jgi:spoIIIJ-associated protein